MDHYADDLATVINTLRLQDATLVGFSTGGGEVARYIGRHGTGKLKRAVLIGAVTPLMLQTPDNPNGSPISVFDGLRNGQLAIVRSCTGTSLPVRSSGSTGPARRCRRV